MPNNKATKVKPQYFMILNSLSLLSDLIEAGGKIKNDPRSINYLMSHLDKKNMSNVEVRKVWLEYKDAVEQNKLDLSTAIILVQASAKNVIEGGRPSRLYYIKAAHSYTLDAKNANHRFYINFVHALFQCGPHHVQDIIDQLNSDTKLKISKSYRKKVITLLNAAVKEYHTYGLRSDMVYDDDLPVPPITTENQDSNIAIQKQILERMALYVDSHIKNYNYKPIKYHEKGAKKTVNTEMQAMPQEKKIEAPNHKAELLAAKQQQYVTDINNAAYEKDWTKALETFEAACLEFPNNIFIYNAILHAADECNRYTYAKILYIYMITTPQHFADIYTHTHALSIFLKIDSEFSLAEYAYNELKRLSNLGGLAPSPTRADPCLTTFAENPFSLFNAKAGECVMQMHPAPEKRATRSIGF